MNLLLINVISYFATDVLLPNLIAKEELDVSSMKLLSNMWPVPWNCVS